ALLAHPKGGLTSLVGGGAVGTQILRPLPGKRRLVLAVQIPHVLKKPDQVVGPGRTPQPVRPALATGHGDAGFDTEVQQKALQLPKVTEPVNPLALAHAQYGLSWKAALAGFVLDGGRAFRA